MATRLLKLDDNIYIEATQPPGFVESISAGDAEEINGFRAKLCAISKLLDAICSPIKEIHQQMGDAIERPTEVELGISFEGGGSIYLVKAQSEASLRIKLRIR